MVLHESVRSNLTDIELRIAEAGTRSPIKSIPDNELISQSGILATTISRDLGIKSWNNPESMKYDANRFYFTIKNYYSEMTLREVKTAFELLSVGTLDPFLPKDKHGHAEKGHYQEFSKEFICKVLNAFKKSKMKVWSKVNKSLPEASLEATEEEKDLYKKSFLENICRKFKDYRDEGIYPRFLVPSLVIKKMVDFKLISIGIELNDTNISNGYEKAVVSNTATTGDRIRMSKDRKDGKRHRLVIANAERDAHQEAIIYVFDKLIKEKKELISIFKI